MAHRKTTKRVCVITRPCLASVRMVRERLRFSPNVEDNRSPVVSKSQDGRTPKPGQDLPGGFFDEQVQRFRNTRASIFPATEPMAVPRTLPQSYLSFFL